jgi:hypothetical protein
MYKSTKEIDAIRRRCNDVENELIDEFLAERIARRDFLRHGVVLGISASLVASLADCADAPSYPLDLVPGASTAYSFRKLRSAYAGSAVQVRRSSDSALQNIGFAGLNFDTAGFTTFIGAGTGSAATWYDQSGNANNAAQATTANQPVVTSPGASVYGGNATGGPGKRMVASDVAGFQNVWANGGFVALAILPTGGGAAVNGTFIGKGSAAGGYVIYTHQGTDHQFVLLVEAATKPAVYWTNQILTPGTPHIATVAWNSSIPTTPAVMTIDGVTCTFKMNQTPVGAIGSDAGSPPILWNDFVLNAGNAAPAGNIYEVLIYKSIPATDAQTSLINNMRAYYGTP